MKPKFLIDANLPYYFNLWNNPEYLHVKDLDDTLSDEQIWNYAKQNDLIIITKDADFSLKILTLGSPPKVIHIRFGNLKMKDFHDKISQVWDIVQKEILENNLINIYQDRIETVNL
jgi:predicted nuclease of predicted toxin-antitoxin system